MSNNSNGTWVFIKHEDDGDPGLAALLLIAIAVIIVGSPFYWIFNHFYLEPKERREAERYEQQLAQVISFDELNDGNYVTWGECEYYSYLDENGLQFYASSCPTTGVFTIEGIQNRHSYSTLKCTVNVDIYIELLGVGDPTAELRVYGDGRLLYSSGRLSKDTSYEITVDIRGVRNLRFEVNSDVNCSYNSTTIQLHNIYFYA